MFYLREYPEFFAAVPLYYWPVLCWELFWHRRWCEAELARRSGVDTQMIVSVTWTGRVVVRFIGDEREPDWQASLSAYSAAASRLTVSSPFDLIEGPISDAVCTLRDLSLDRNSALASDSRVANAEHLRPLLDPC